MGHQDVIDAMIKHFEGVVGRPHQAFNGMPMCPFVMKALRERKIEFIVTPFDLTDLDDPASEVMRGIEGLKDPELTLVFVYPDKAGMPVAALHQLVKELLARIGPGYVAFDGHPEDDFEIRGIFPRREPYPNFQVMHASLLASSLAKLKGSNYYKGWSKEDIEKL